jgi:hypothetical protein
MNKFLLAVTALVTIGGSALAADIPVRRQVPAYGPPPVLALFNLERVLCRWQCGWSVGPHRMAR